MAYEKRTWVPGVTKCSAENFNHMEDGIETAQKGVDELNTNLLLKNITMGKFINFAQTPRTLLESTGSNSSPIGSIVVDLSCFSADNSDTTTNSPYVGMYPRWYNIITLGVTTRCSQIAISCYEGSQSIWIRYQHDDRVSGWKQLG